MYNELNKTNINEKDFQTILDLNKKGLFE